ncbi:hypothetical protein LTR56_011689 [Elasticomyces elasticus]|nr:hypothetical protein LTR56_011689 [Elasticomyces elasticus]KAK3658524.1 hypothetical protein LTR22_008877 [Elasticomyces elasticus]KAK4921172.1 hypothetical protein LTR49_011359 [Elasticomyces elasticus]KAK5761889.1 hypothetical protein LTS12_007952 [Elasticomyces elasticus]
MANTLTADQLQRLLALSCIENEKILREQQLLKGANERLLREHDAFRREQNVVQRETLALKSAKQVQQTQIDALMKGRQALFKRIRTLEDGVSSGSDPRGTLVLRSSPSSTHDEAATSSAREASLKRKLVETGEDSNIEKRKQKRSVSASDGAMETSGFDSLQRTTFATDMVRTGGSDTGTTEDAPVDDASCSTITVLAFNEHGKIYALDEADEPVGLRALIANTEVSLAEEFEKHRRGVWNKYTSWKDCGRRGGSCIRQVCRSDVTLSTLENSEHAACQKCFNKRLPCMRHDQSEPTRGICVVPLPPSAREGVSQDQLAYYVYQGLESHDELEKVMGDVWVKRKPDNRKSRPKKSQVFPRVENGLTIEGGA